MTDTMGRMHSDAQFAGSSSVPAHIEMMGFLGIGNIVPSPHITVNQSHAVTEPPISPRSGSSAFPC